MDIILFCPDCHRYIGESDACLFCGWVRPAHAHLPQPGIPLWELPAEAAPRCPPIIDGEVVYVNLPGKGLLAASLADEFTSPLGELEADVLGFAGELTRRGILVAKA